MSDRALKSALKPTLRGSGNRVAESGNALLEYSYAERRAILDHRFFLSIELQREASLGEALESWEAGVCDPWRCEKMRRDRHAQLKEIERHKYYLSMQCGYDIGWEPAALDWVKNHAAKWREWWERHWWEEQWWERQQSAAAVV